MFYQYNHLIGLQGENMENHRNYARSQYNSKVKIGNWNEELMLKEAGYRQFIEKKNQGELLIQKVRTLHSNLLKEIKIQTPCPHIKFGSIVQLVAPDIPVDRPGGKWTLSISIDEKYIQCTQQISEKCHLTVSFTETSLTRNSFKIVSADGLDRNEEILKYDQDFMLECMEGDKSPLVLYSSPKSAGLINGNLDPHPSPFYNQISEESQSVGIYHLPPPVMCTTKEAEKIIPFSHCRWRAVNIDPTIRYETEGDPIPSNRRLIIRNSFTNRNLAAEFVWTKTFFGMELGVSCNNYLNQHRRELCQNIWMFGTETSI